MEQTFTLHANPPFRLDLTAWALRRRAKNLIDQWDGRSYSRVIAIGSQPVRLQISESTSSHTPGVLVAAQSDRPLPKNDYLTSLIDKMLGLSLELHPFYALAAQDKMLRPLVRKFSGLKPPRFPTLFEALVNAVACQQVSLDSGIALLNRLAETYGLEFTDVTTQHAFPRPSDFLSASPEELRDLGMSRQKAATLLGLANLFNAKPDLETLGQAPSGEVYDRLLAIKGIGRWSAQYALLRGLGRLDSFPGDDIGGQNNLQALLRLNSRPTYDEVVNLLARWHPYEGFIYLHLLISKLSDRKILNA